MRGMMGFGLLFLLVPLILLLGSIGGLIFVWVKVFIAGKAKPKTDGLACCGACGYPMRGASEFICVECGADLREVGIVTDQQRKPMIGPAVFLALWTVCLPVPAFTLATILIWAGPSTPVGNVSMTVTPQSTGQYQSIDINNINFSGFMWMGGGTQAPTHDLMLMIHGNNNQWEHLTVDAATMTFDANVTNFTQTGNPSAAASTTPLDQPALLAWMQAAGADPTNADVIAEADALHTMIQQFPQSGLQVNAAVFSTTQNSNFSMDVPAAWWVLTVFGTIPVIWIAGIVLYFVIRKKRNPLPAMRADRNPYGPTQTVPPSGQA